MGIIVITMMVVSVVFFFILYNVNEMTPEKLNIRRLRDLIAASLVCGVMLGGVVGLLIAGLLAK